MLRSHAPSRRVAGRNLKRQKTTPTKPEVAAAGSDDQTSTAPAAGTLPRFHSTAGAAARVSRSSTLPAIKVSADGVESCSRPHKQSRRGGGSQEQERLESTTSIQEADPSTGGGRRGAAPGGLANRYAVATNSQSAATGAGPASGPVRRVKVRGHRRASSTTTPASNSPDLEWRVPPQSVASGRNGGSNSKDSSISSSLAISTSSRGGPRKKQDSAEAVPPPAETATRPGTPNSDGRTSTTSTSSGSCSSGTTSRRGSSRIKLAPPTAPLAAAAAAEIGHNESDSNCSRASPRKKQLSSSTQPVTTAEKEEKEEGEELPACPYPGHKNVSWTCRACGGARHHLTSRSAMEPLQRAHGFKVQRVPNDGDCFFSSIEAALSDGELVDGGKGQGSSGAEGAVAGTPGTGVVERGELTVARMREWVAEETGQEQLDFYILQAGANPEDRWLDFVRPLEDRIPSDDEEEEEDEEEEDEDGSYKDENESVASSCPTSQSQSQSQSKSKPRSKTASASRRSASRQAASRNLKDSSSSAPSSGDGGGVGKGKSKRQDARSKGGAASSNGNREENAGAGVCVKGVSSASSSSSSDRNARRIGRRRNGGRGLLAVKESTSAAAETDKKGSRHGKSSSGQSASGTGAASTTVSASRKSSRLRTVSTWRVGENTREEEEEEEEEEEKERGDGERKEEDEQSEGLPVVTTVEELRRFVRLEGSVVGHGNCMWADTFAHHVVSRRLKITILFIDMEREKSAWPYRVLARTATETEDKDNERFVVLKREPSHFVLLRTLPSPEDKKGVAGIDGDGGGAAATRRKGGGGQACFSRSELPDVVRRLWQL